MKIQVQAAPKSERRAKPGDESHLGFGQLYSDHMFTMEWTSGEGWHSAKVSPFAPLTLSPATLCLHYGQMIFEGLKAYRTSGDTLNLFRPLMNWERFQSSAHRLAMAGVPQDVWLQALEKLLELDHEWVPHAPGASLYIRPTLIATEPFIGVKSSGSLLFFIITGPVGAYYATGFNPVKIVVEERYSRAAPGGLGAAKTPANYAASLLAAQEAHARGFSQVLWLDATEHKYAEEVGAMNILFKIGGKVITPPLDGTILAGVTRDSVLQLLKRWDIPAEERKISMDELVEAHRNGTLEEVFGAGTAAVISPVGLLQYRDNAMTIADGKTGPLARRLYDEITAIQWGQKPDLFGWNHSVRIPIATPITQVAG